METSRVTKLARLAPQTLGESNSIGSGLRASFNSNRGQWRVEWLGGSGKPFSAEGPVGGGEWSLPLPESNSPRDDGPPAIPPSEAGANVPPGLLTSTPLPTGIAD